MAERKREVWVCKFTAKSGRVFTELFDDEAKKDAYMQVVPSEGNPTAERYVPAESGQSEAWERLSDAWVQYQMRDMSQEEFEGTVAELLDALPPPKGSADIERGKHLENSNE